MGYAALAIDVKHGTHMDVLKPEVHQLLSAWIRSGVVWAVWLGTPCTTWSVAYTTPVVRSTDHPWGVPGLPSKHAQAVSIGNQTARFTAHIIKTCCAHNIPVCLENPASSRLWKCPALACLLPSASDCIRSAYCQFGTPWRKITQVAGWSVGSLAPMSKQCHGQKGVCSKTGRPHKQLNGRSNGISWTKIAEPYPKPLCAHLVKQIMKSSDLLALQRRYEVLEKSVPGAHPTHHRAPRNCWPAWSLSHGPLVRRPASQH